ncbi:hypothetical protein H920_03227 [Fukomys damarensis]|uniref:Uncharacterized protein n=2 Tax=Fukomys damarensis TaxID=885580 RepID=A0A091DT86_FUKDA|nr:hypothetical protein H920_03227 [Fukomys damarensis]
MGFLWDPLTYALACSHCGHCCLHSPGYLVILFLFVVWQIQRWQQRESWCSGDTMQGKDLPLQYDLAFFDHLWQKKSEKEGKEREEEEDQSTSLEPVKLCSPEEAPTGDEDTTAPLQPSCGSESLPKATGTREQISTQPSCPFRSFPTLQITTNLPVRNKNASRSCLQQRKGQLFFGLPSQHSESLETIFLSLDSSSPLKLSACPVFFNKLPFLPRYNLLLHHYCSPTQLPIHEAHTREDLEGMASDAQLVPPPSSSPVPSLSLHLKPLPMDNYDGEAHKQWLKQERDILQVSDDQTLYPQRSLQGIRTSNCLSSSEACRGEPWDPRLHQHNPESPSTSPLYSSSSLGVLTRFEALLRAMKENKHPKGCEPAMPAPSPSLASLPELQRVSPMGGLSGSKTLWETTEQKKDPQTSEPPILAACQTTVPMTEFQRSSSPCSLPRYEAQWGTTGHKESPQVSEPSNSDSCQSLVSLPEPPKVSPKHSAPKNFQGNMGYRENPQVKSPMPAHFSPLDSYSKLQEKNPPKYSFGYEPQWEYTANLGNPSATELPSLDCNAELCETRPVCPPSGSETPWKSMQTRALWVSADSVSPPSLLSLPSAFRLQSLEKGSQGLLSESKALWDTKGQKMYFWVCDSSEPAQITPLASLVEPHRITAVGGLSRLETTRKVTEHSKNSWASEPFLALSPSPTLVCKPVKAIPMGALSNEATCEDIQRKKNRASELPTPSLLQDLHGASLLVVSDSEPLMGNMEHKENYCVPIPPIWGSSSLANSVSKSHINESTGDQSKCKPEGKAVELRDNCWATELPAPSSLSAPLPEPHANLKFVYKDVQKEVPWGISPAVGDPLHLIPWPPILAEAPKIEPTQCGPHKGEMFPEVKAEVPSSQGQAVPEVLTHSRVPAWRWSRELENRLKKLQQNPAFTSPGPSQPFCSSAALSSTRLDSWKLSSWAPKETHAPNLYLHSCCHPPNVQSTAPQPVQDSHYLHSSQELQPLASRQAEQGSQKEERIKGKMVAQIPSHGPGFHKKAGANFLGLGKPSNTGVLASGKRQNKALALSLAKKRENPRKLKTVECGRGNARLGSSTVTGKSHPDQAWRLTEGPVSRLSQRSQHKGQTSQHTALPRQLFKDAGPQDKQSAGLATGGIQNPQHCKHCPQAHMERHLSTPTSQVPITRGLQRVFAKLWGTHGLSPI